MPAFRRSPINAWISLLEKNAEASQSLQNAESTVTRNFAWSLDFATAVAVNNIRSSANEIRVSMRTVIEAAIPPVAPQQGIFVAFAELDTNIFGGRLKEAVFLKWSHVDGPSSGKTSTPGTGNPRITIELDERLMYGPKAQLIVMLIHQMTHAYFLVCCDPPKVAGRRDLRLEHGRHFCMVIYSVTGLYRHCQREDTHRRRLGTESMIRQGPRVRWNAMEPHGVSYGRRSGNRDLDQPSNNHSFCSRPLQCELPINGVRQWYGEECEHIDISRANEVYMLTDSGVEAQPRVKAGPGSNFVEFIWDEKAFKIPRARIEVNASLKIRLGRQKNGRELQIPPVSREAFSSLYSFVKTGAYSPELMKVQNNRAKAPANVSTAGPPEILETRKDWPDFLGTDIRAIKLAAQMGYCEMECYGLRRLSAQHFSHNDPIAALEAVYEDAPLPEKLRDWVVSFMAKPLSLRHAGQTERCNLDLLQHSLSFTSGMTRLIERSGALREDVRKAEARMARLPHEPSNQRALINLPVIPRIHQPSYHFPSDTSRRNSITLPEHFWNEKRILPLSYADPIGGRATSTPPATSTRWLPHAIPSAYASHDGSMHVLGEHFEPPYSERDEYWEQFH